MGKKNISDKKQAEGLFRIITPTGRGRNLIFITAVILTIIIIAALSSLAEKQDQHFVQNLQLYQKGKGLAEHGHYKEAIDVFSQLDPGFRDGYRALYLTAFCYGSLKEYEPAARYMQKAQDSFPLFLEDPYFLLEYGEYLYHLGDYEKSSMYLNQSLKFGRDQELPVKAQQLLNEIAQLDRGGH